ncbi:extracellular solute-binding protein [Sporolactobacillus shoreicorticis]|uniref:ABC transporter substrate-binding protein n=1 Tax=Sporolactobacillus shoreicorticis TaxID=1923877 RepID=A0ABW5S330_9BACL|nr:extracellular solute-binding protein [Sporolactobacillus shoreicorticis]MCO7124241.1 extracellular solute-binding protein [Sporolactobacillus shoreicorticis]
MNKLTGILLCVALLVGVLAGCGNSNKTDDKTSKPTINILTAVTGGKDEEGMKAFEKELGQLTGYKINMIKPADDYNTVLMQKLKAGGENLDLVYFDQSQLPDLVKQGALQDITSAVEDSNILSDTSIIPEKEWKNIEIDGKIYASFNKKEIERVVNVNEGLINKYGIDFKDADTLDGYYQLFKQLKDKDKTQGFYPFNVSLSLLFDLQPWFASEGLKGGIVVDENGKKTVPWSTDAAAPVWSWLRKLYKEGLMDPDALTDTTKELRNKFQSSQTGVVTDWAAWTGLYNVNAAGSYPNEFKAVAHGGTKNKDGAYMLTRGAASLWGIPSTSKNAKEAMKVLETLATQKGGDLLSVGAKGYDYTDDNGKVELTEKGKEAGMDHGAPFPISEKYKSPLPYNPGVEDALGFLKYASTESYLPETADYTTIVSKEAIRMVKGEVSVEDGLKEMRENLKAKKVID